MVSSAHEAMHQIFREDPGLITRVLPKAGIPSFEPTAIQPLDTDLTEIRPVARRVDTLFRVDTEDHGSFLLAVESQGKPDPDKLNSWTYYLAYLYAKYQLPPILVVVCQDKATASWAAAPIRIGLPVHTSLAAFPLVVGPDTLPAVMDPDEVAQDFPFAAFSALTHARDPALPVILEALAAVLDDMDSEAAEDWAEYIEMGLGDARTRELWRHVMKTRTSRFPGSGTLIEETRIKGREEGLTEGRAADVLRILDRRGIEVPEVVRERVTSCTDLEVLGTWFDRALTASNAEELFEGA